MSSLKGGSDQFTKKVFRVVNKRYGEDIKCTKEVYYYNTGQIASIIKYIDGVKTGIGMSFYKNGSVSARIPYKKDTYDGFYMTFYKNGVRKEKSLYKKGCRSGLSVKYDKEGNVNSCAYYKNGKICGWSIRKDGDKAKASYKDGKISIEIITSERDITKVLTPILNSEAIRVWSAGKMKKKGNSKGESK